MSNKGEYRYTYNDEGKLVAQRYGIDKNTNEGQWYDVGNAVPSDRTMSGGKVTRHNVNVNAVQKQKAMERARDLYIRGKGAQLRDEDVKEMGFVDKSMALAGRETDKLMSGAANLVDFVQGTKQELGESVFGPEDSYDTPYAGVEQNNLFSDVGNRLYGDPSKAYEDTNARAAEQAEKDYYSRELESNAGLAEISKALPYFVTGMAGPAFARKGSQAINLAAEGVKTGARRIGGRAGDVVRRSSARGNPIAQKAEREIMNPVEDYMVGLKARPKIRNEFRAGLGGELLGGSALGAIESGVHYDEDVMDGVYSSLLGTSVGKTFEPFLAKAPSKLTQAEQDVLKWAHSKGYRPLPGMATGQPRYQMREAGLRNDEKYAGPMRQLDEANDTVITNTAGEVMGLTPKQMSELTPETLDTHLKSLSDEYQALEAASIGRIEKSKLKELRDLASNQPNTPVGNKNTKTILGLMDEFDRLNKGAVRDTRGRFKAATFDGSQYQDIRRKIKSAADMAYDKKNTDLYDSLKVMLNSLDEGMEKGIEKYGGKASSQMWKDLNERYAMTHLVMQHGMNPMGGINLKRMGNYLMENDAKRTLTGQGGRVKDLQQLIKLDFMSKNQMGGGLSGAGIEHINKEPKSESSRLFSTPKDLEVPLNRYLRLRAYQFGYPARTGLLNLPRKSALSAPNIYRAVEQGSDVHYERGKEAAEWGLDKYKKGSDFVDRLYARMMGEEEPQ